MIYSAGDAPPPALTYHSTLASLGAIAAESSLAMGPGAEGWGQAVCVAAAASEREAPFPPPFAPSPTAPAAPTALRISRPHRPPRAHAGTLTLSLASLDPGKAARPSGPGAMFLECGLGGGRCEVPLQDGKTPAAWRDELLWDGTGPLLCQAWRLVPGAGAAESALQLLASISVDLASVLAKPGAAVALVLPMQPCGTLALTLRFAAFASPPSPVLRSTPLPSLAHVLRCLPLCFTDPADALESLLRAFRLRLSLQAALHVSAALCRTMPDPVAAALLLLPHMAPGPAAALWRLGVARSGVLASPPALSALSGKLLQLQPAISLWSRLGLTGGYYCLDLGRAADRALLGCLLARAGEVERAGAFVPAVAAIRSAEGGAGGAAGAAAAGAAKTAPTISPLQACCFRNLALNGEPVPPADVRSVVGLLSGAPGGGGHTIAGAQASTSAKATAAAAVSGMAGVLAALRDGGVPQSGRIEFDFCDAMRGSAEAGDGDVAEAPVNAGSSSSSSSNDSGEDGGGGAEEAAYRHAYRAGADRGYPHCVSDEALLLLATHARATLALMIARGRHWIDKRTAPASKSAASASALGSRGHARRHSFTNAPLAGAAAAGSVGNGANGGSRGSHPDSPMPGDCEEGDVLGSRLEGMYDQVAASAIAATPALPAPVTSRPSAESPGPDRGPDADAPPALSDMQVLLRSYQELFAQVTMYTCTLHDMIRRAQP